MKNDFRLKQNSINISGKSTTLCDHKKIFRETSTTFESLNAARMFCYSRMVYMPMSYLYGKRFIGPITLLVLELREELFLQPYNEINWKKVRHLCAKVSFDFLWKQFLFLWICYACMEHTFKIFYCRRISTTPIP